jgi:hypothetical protein
MGGSLTVAQRSIAVRKSGIHGRGVFALRPIPKGREIIRYRGRLVTHDEADEGSVDNGHTFLFILNDHYVIDAADGGNSARWINHGCQPNCVAYQHESPSGDPSKDRVVIESLRDIAAGEELTYDYRIETEDPVTASLKKQWACRCGAGKCRGTMLRRRRAGRRNS